MPDEEEKKTYICPCCGHEMDAPPIKIDGKVVDDYLSSIMTGEPFSHTFPLFDGKLKIMIKAISREAGLVLYDFVLLVEPYTRESSQLRDMLGVVNAYCLVNRIILKTEKDEHVYLPAKAIMEEVTKIVDDYGKANMQDEEVKAKFLQDIQAAYHRLSNNDVLSSTPPMIMNRIIEDFKKLETMLLEAGFDENFWQGIVLA